LSPKHAEEVTIDNRQMTSIEMKFANAFRTLSRAERVPALVISDQKGRVTFAQHGRMSAEEISKALGAN
ncbi:MAG: hypothetical protein KDB07_10290, partial [Planctomycetes bacterium]|nr:hypothetical protein [Planctomycetota bacterium]